MRIFGLMHAVFLVVIPLGVLLTFGADSIVAFFDDRLEVSIERGDIAIVFLVVSVLISRYGYRQDAARRSRNK